MFAVFRNVLGHSWESLPESYRSSAKLSLDVSLIHTDEPMEAEVQDDAEDIATAPQLVLPDVHELPLHRVCGMSGYSITSKYKDVSQPSTAAWGI